MGTQQPPQPLIVKAAQCHHIGFFNPLQLVRVVKVGKVARNSKLIDNLVLQGTKQLHR